MLHLFAAVGAIAGLVGFVVRGAAAAAELLAEGYCVTHSDGLSWGRVGDGLYLMCAGNKDVKNEAYCFGRMFFGYISSKVLEGGQMCNGWHKPPK